MTNCGGKLSKQDAHPAVVALIDQKFKPFCTGSLIAPRVIRTAKHCTERNTLGHVTQFQPKQIKVYFGNGHRLNQFQNEPLFAVEEIIRSPTRRLSEIYFRDKILARERQEDIAILIILSEHIEDILPLKVVDTHQHDPPEDELVQLVGFGKTRTLNYGRKREIKAPIEEKLTNQFLIGEINRGGFNGDSGGPALMPWQCIDGSTDWRIIATTRAAHRGARGFLVGAYEPIIKSTVNWINEALLERDLDKIPARPCSND